MTNSDLQQLAEVWFGGAERRAETPAGSTSTTQTVTATAVEDSSDGSVRVILSDVVIPDEDPPTEDASMTSDEDVIDEPTDFPDVAVELPTAVDVREGDELLVSLYGGDGQLSPVVTAVAAGGDRTREEVQQAAQDASHAAEMAGEAAAAATATNQHFWWDASGAHVATTAGDSDSGPNVVLSSGGMVIRDGTNPLSAATSSGFSVYDGNGNTSSNLVALLSRDTIELGRNNPSATVKMCGGAAIVRSDVTGSSTKKNVTVQVGPNFRPDGVSTDAVKTCSIGFVPFSGYSGGVPTSSDVGLFFRYDGTTTPATSKVQAYNSDLQVDGILMTPAMNHANLHAEPVYSGVTWNTNGYGGINLSVVRGMAVMRVDINIKTGTVKRWGKVLPPSIIRAIETWAKPPADGVQLRSAAGVGGWVASLNSGGNGKYYLWPTVESVPAGSSLTDTFMWPVDYGR